MPVVLIAVNRIVSSFSLIVLELDVRDEIMMCVECDGTRVAMSTIFFCGLGRNPIMF